MTASRVHATRKARSPERHPRASATRIQPLTGFSRIHGFRPIRHTAPEFEKIRRAQFHMQSASDQADSHSWSTTHQKQSKHATLGCGITGKSNHKQIDRSKDERCAFCAILLSRLVKPQGCTQPRRKHQPIQATTHHSNAIAPLE